MDKSLFTSCRYTGKVKTVDNASEFRTCFECGGITHKTVGDARTTTYDLTKDNKVNSTTEIVPPTDLLPQEDFRCSYCASVLPDYDKLSAEVALAQASHDAAVEGATSGQYAVGSKATLQTAIDAATTFIGTVDGATTVIGEGQTIDGLIQSQLDTLTTALATFEAGKVA